VKDDNSFIRDLNESRDAVNEFATKAWAKGVQVWLPPEKVRPDVSERREYADDGDMMLQARIEHKVRKNLSWTCREDYRYPTVIVDEVYKEDAKSDRPVLMYVIEDQTRQHAAVVYGWTRSKWNVERMHDPIQNRVCEFYTVDKRYVRFCQVDSIF
jgi:hypothetical protein